MSGSFVAHERNDDERRNGDSLDRNATNTIGTSGELRNGTAG